MPDAFQSQYAEFTRNMGVCLVKFSEIERVLFNIFETALGSSNHLMADKLYSSIISFNIRRALIDAAVDTNLLAVVNEEREDLVAEWKTLQKTMNEKLPKRNKVAHYFYYLWGWEGRVEPVLQQPFFSWKDGKPTDLVAPVDNQQLLDLQSDLDKLREALSNFWQNLVSAKRERLKPRLP